MNPELWLFIEGEDDQRFIESVLQRRLEEIWSVRLIRYAERPNSKIVDYLRSGRAMEVRHILLADFDRGPCIERRKRALCRAYRGLRPEHIIIVKNEIESWFAAGVTAEGERALKAKFPRNTDDYSKEEFLAKIPERLSPKRVFFTELLEYYSLQTALRRNQSLRYFCEKCGIC